MPAVRAGGGAWVRGGDINEDIMSAVCARCNPGNVINYPADGINFIRCPECREVYPFRDPADRDCIRCGVKTPLGMVLGAVEFVTCFRCDGSWAVPTGTRSNPFVKEFEI